MGNLLEVNPNPGWVWDGRLNKMVSLAGISYSELLRMIIVSAEKRLNRKEKMFEGIGRQEKCQRNVKRSDFRIIALSTFLPFH